jgi:uncharacterized membrane protein
MVLDRLVTTLGDLFEINGKRSAKLNAVILAMILLAVTGVGYTIASSGGNDNYTEFYLLSEDQSGKLVGQDYPKSIPVDRPSTFYVGIGNHWLTPKRYSLVVKLQRIYFDNGTPEVFEENVLQSSRVRVAQNDRRILSTNVTPQMRGSRMRIVFLLHRGDPPERPSMENAYHEAHLWVNVTLPSNEVTSPNRPTIAA